MSPHPAPAPNAPSAGYRTTPSDPERPGVADIDVSSAHRLPRTFVPHRYDLHLKPDLVGATFTGTVVVTGVITKATTEIVFNAAELDITSAGISAGQGDADPNATGELQPATASLDPDKERVTLTTGAELPPGPCKVEMAFAGILNDQLHGFYRSTFIDDAGTVHTIATTQFEATDARRAFPCLDEPDAKAVFSITLDVPVGLSAFSNGPEISSRPTDGGGRTVCFGDTIAMSTYLVAFVVGPLVASDAVDAGGVPVRVIHVPGKDDLTAFALECAAHALSFFTDWFDIQYPAEKLDLLAIPDFAFGAMENLGCVTFRESALLVDPLRASRLEQERVADVISHEIAHMWFGDLVTMKWWNGIWLNEAFATLMELLCVDHFRPEWRRWVSFGMERDVAMAIDSLHSTRAVEYPVGPPEEAQGMFDVLTYQKGASVLRMLERYLGPDKFKAGIRLYLDRHRLANTETSDLWDAIEAASGEPVSEIMATWIYQGGFPIVDVTSDGVDVILSQTPFSFTNAASRSSAIGADWLIPIIARLRPVDSAPTDNSHSAGGERSSQGEDDAERDDATSRRVLLASEPAGLLSGAHGEALIVNAGGSGYYRVRYDADTLKSAVAAFGRLETLEKFNLLSDTWASVIAGRSPIGDFLTLAEALRDSGDLDPDVWGQATGPLGFLDRVLDGEDRVALAQYTNQIMSPLLNQLGWERRPHDSDRLATMRSLTISTLGCIGRDSNVAALCAEIHQDFDSNGTAIDPDLASAIVGVVAQWGLEPEFDSFLEHYRNPETPQEEVRYLYALAAFGPAELSSRAFDLAITEVRTQNAPFVIHGLLANREAGPDTWRRIKDHWATVVNRTPSNILPRMLDGVRFLCREPQALDDVRSFLAAHPIPVGQRTVDQAVERLEINIGLARRVADESPSALSAAIKSLAG